jgi:hypothetical protein
MEWSPVVFGGAMTSMFEANSNALEAVAAGHVSGAAHG